MDETLPFEEYLKQNFAEEGFLVVEEPPPVTLIVSKVEKEACQRKAKTRKEVSKCKVERPLTKLKLFRRRK